MEIVKIRRTANTHKGQEQSEVVEGRKIQNRKRKAVKLELTQIVISPGQSDFKSTIIQVFQPTINPFDLSEEKGKED